MNFTRHISPHMLGMADADERVRFLNKNGYPMDLEHARKHLEEGGEYIVKDVSIGDWSSSYSFVGSDERFNTVMFEPVAESDAPKGDA